MRRGGRRRDDVQGRAERPRPAARRAAVLRPDRRRQDAPGPGAGRLPVRARRAAGPDDPAGHERVRRARRGRPPARPTPPAGPASWSSRVRQQPFSVLLLDEVEKAAADVFDVLLGVFDEGRLTDRYGRVTNFRSSVIVMTSNLGAGSGGRSGSSQGAAADEAAADAVTGRSRVLPPGVLQPHRRGRPVPPARPGRRPARSRRRSCRELAKREGLAKANLTLAWTPAVVERWRRRATTRGTGPARSSGRSSRRW